MEDAKRMEKERSIFNGILVRLFNNEDIPPNLKLYLKTEKGKFFN